MTGLRLLTVPSCRDRAVCICVGGSRIRRRIADLYSKCGVALLDIRRTKQLAVLLSKSRQDSIIMAETAELHTRSEDKRNMALRRMWTELGKRNPLYQGSNISNGLSKTIQDAPNKSTFKN